MEFIDKSTNQQSGYGYVDELLHEAWNVAENKYIGADYEGLNREKYRTGIVGLLLNEQHDKCCYCMKRLEKNDVTVEHVIPQAVSIDKLNEYLELYNFESTLLHKNNFNIYTKIIPPLKYPHDIAYHNLLASCNSSKHCNNFRGNEFLKPFVFDREIGSKVIYDVAGRIDCEEYMHDIEVLGLVSNETLRLIRRLWRILSNRFENIEDVSNDKIEKEIYALIDDQNYYLLIENFTGNPSYLSELCKYKWFFKYYKMGYL